MSALALGQTGKACYPVNLDAQRAWHAAQVPTPPEQPAPEVPARMASPDEVHRARSIEGLRRLARAHGWACNVTYARGHALAAERADCVVCGIPVTVLKDGTSRAHGSLRRGEPCAGSGRSPYRHRPGVGPLVESLALRMRREGHGAVAVWQTAHKGAPFGYVMGYFWPSTEHPWPSKVNLATLRELLGTGDAIEALDVAEGGQQVLIFEGSEAA